MPVIFNNGDKMSLHDCVKCWSTPCVCGWDYRDLSKESRLEHASVVLGIDIENLRKIIFKIIPEKHPMKENLKCCICENETKNSISINDNKFICNNCLNLLTKNHVNYLVSCAEGSNK